MPKENVSYTEVGYRPDVIETYRKAPCREVPKALDLHIYKAKEAAHAPLFVWFHSGGFRTGRIVHASHRVIARRMTAAGITVVFPEYRLGSAEADLEAATLDEMTKRAADAHPAFPAAFRGSEAMAALEDGAAVLQWLEAKREDLGILGPIVIGGSSAGGVTAMNLAFLAPGMGWDVPMIGGVIAMSGAFAFPDLVKGNPMPVMGICNPADERMPPRSMIECARQSAAFDLHLSGSQEHGDFRMSPGERKGRALGRMIRAVEAFSGVQAKAAE